MDELKDKVAIVTGGGSGIGARTARMFALEGATVVVADLNQQAAQEVADGITEAGGRAGAVAFDLGDEDSIADMIASAVSFGGGLDVVFNNAAATHLAGQRDQPIADADPSVWDDTFRINVRGTMLCTKLAAPHIIARGGGSIINTSSDAGMTGDIGHPAYGASKSAIVRMTTYVALEYGKQGLRCNAISPGLIVTPATESTWAAGPMRDLMLRQHLTPRLGSPDDVANAAVFLASDRSGFITGQVIAVDGGLLSHAPYAADLTDLMAGARQSG